MCKYILSIYQRIRTDTDTNTHTVISTHPIQKTHINLSNLGLKDVPHKFPVCRQAFEQSYDGEFTEGSLVVVGTVRKKRSRCLQCRWCCMEGRDSGT